MAQGPPEGAPANAPARPRGERLQVGGAEAGLRLDAFLTRQGLFASAAAARRAIAAGGVRIDGRPARKGHRLRAGEALEVAAGEAGVVVVPDAGLPLAVLYADEALVAVDKPAGMAVHPLAPGEGGTLVSALVARFPECAAASPDAREAGLVHRLDVGTSGVLLAARRPELWPVLRQLLGGAACEKTYLAEVAALPAGAGVGQTVVVEAPIGRSGRRSGKVRVGAGRGLLPARTALTWLAGGTPGGTWLVQARLARGRPHQVRVHLAHLGAPVLGDPVYGDAHTAALAAARALTGFHLHAWRVSFSHPLTGQTLLLEAPAPPWARAHLLAGRNFESR